MNAGLSIKVKSLFFDRTAVINAVDKATLTVLRRFGGFVRIVARRSIRTRKNPSVPGTPPSSHSGYLKKGIVFAYDPSHRSVLVGPLLTKFSRRAADGRPLFGATVPSVLEYGGSVQAIEYQRQLTARGRQLLQTHWGRDPDQWHRLGRKRLYHRPGNPLKIRATRQRTVGIAARPYMAPAFEKGKARLSGMWANSVKP